MSSWSRKQKWIFFGTHILFLFILKMSIQLKPYVPLYIPLADAWSCFLKFLVYFLNLTIISNDIVLLCGHVSRAGHLHDHRDQDHGEAHCRLPLPQVSFSPQIKTS